MSHPKVPEKVLFFLAVTEAEKDLFEKIYNDHFKELGMVVIKSDTYDFSYYTDYYEEEMGKPLWKTFYFFERLMGPEYLIDLKHLCYHVEKLYSDSQNRRRVNIDPGYLNTAKVVLATFKDYAHRIYIGKSVFAEVTLIYKDGAFRALPWTYSDYKDQKHLEYFQKAREYYKSQRRKLRVNAD